MLHVAYRSSCIHLTPYDLSNPSSYLIHSGHNRRTDVLQNESLSQRLAKTETDTRDYQQLKVAHDMEVDATARLRERLIRENRGSVDAAEAQMRKKGYDPGILKR